MIKFILLVIAVWVILEVIRLLHHLLRNVPLLKRVYTSHGVPIRLTLPGTPKHYGQVQLEMGYPFQIVGYWENKALGKLGLRKVTNLLHAKEIRKRTRGKNGLYRLVLNYQEGYVYVLHTTSVILHNLTEAMIRMEYVTVEEDKLPPDATLKPPLLD